MPISCNRCSGWTASVEEVLEVLEKKGSACERCAHGELMRLVTRQYRMRQPQWWVVDGKRVIPIWIVEHLRKRLQLV